MVCLTPGFTCSSLCESLSWGDPEPQSGVPLRVLHCHTVTVNQCNKKTMSTVTNNIRIQLASVKNIQR